MKTYDFAKAKKLIDEQAADLESASLGMAQDMFWTAQTVFEDGSYTVDLTTVKEIAGIDGSSWATPSLLLTYKDGSDRLLGCYKGQSEQSASPLGNMLGALSGPAQEALPPLED